MDISKLLRVVAGEGSEGAGAGGGVSGAIEVREEPASSALRGEFPQIGTNLISNEAKR